MGLETLREDNDICNVISNINYFVYCTKRIRRKRRKKNSKEQNSNHVDQQQYDYTDKEQQQNKIQMMINKSEKIVKGNIYENFHCRRRFSDC